MKADNDKMPFEGLDSSASATVQWKVRSMTFLRTQIIDHLTFSRCTNEVNEVTPGEAALPEQT